MDLRTTSRAEASASRQNLGFGNQGPDQGYALKIVQFFQDRVYLASNEEWNDAAKAAVIVGLKRASLFGRAPSRYDIEAGFAYGGIFDPEPASDLVKFRIKILKNLSASHDYLMQRSIADSIPAEKLKQGLKKIQEDYQNDWRSIIDTAVLQRNETL